ncbi:MAG: hypothetical protein JRF65_11905 [Deltaproteobacteria bacterium]|nr:hypothetical protein [Deltaproteobacteria bacterium]
MPGFLKWLSVAFGVLAVMSSAWGKYNDYNVNKPSAFRDHQQTMIWDSELLAALSGFQGELMFCTGSCFSGGFVDDLTQLPKAVVVTANTWHGQGYRQHHPRTAVVVGRY